jgi:hypothetical protein
MVCLANKWGKNTRIFLQKMVYLESKNEWFLRIKQGHFTDQTGLFQKQIQRL